MSEMRKGVIVSRLADESRPLLREEDSQNSLLSESGEQLWWANGLLVKPKLVVDWDESMTRGS